jgi:hypothetical protein
VYGYGDVINPADDTVELMEDLLILYIQDLVILYLFKSLSL